MFLQETIKQWRERPRNFTRKSYGQLDSSMFVTIVTNNDGIEILQFVDGERFEPFVSDFDAEDWEFVPEPSIEFKFTRSEFLNLWKECLQEANSERRYATHPPDGFDAFSKLIKKLGF